MVWIKKDSNNNITGYATAQQDDTWIEIEENDASVVAYLANLAGPNVTEFIADIKTAAGGILGANQLAIAYPLFYPALAVQNWEDLHTMLVDALSKNVLNATQYAAVKTSATNNRIPINL